MEKLRRVLETLEKVREIKIVECYPHEEIERGLNSLLRKGWRILYIGENFLAGEGSEIIMILGRGEKEEG